MIRPVATLRPCISLWCHRAEDNIRAWHNCLALCLRPDVVPSQGSLMLFYFLGRWKGGSGRRYIVFREFWLLKQCILCWSLPPRCGLALRQAGCSIRMTIWKLPPSHRQSIAGAGAWTDGNIKSPRHQRNMGFTLWVEAACAPYPQCACAPWLPRRLWPRQGGRAWPRPSWHRSGGSHQWNPSAWTGCTPCF